MKIRGWRRERTSPSLEEVYRIIPVGSHLPSSSATVAVLYGERGTAELLILSQVVLSLQLSFAVIPLVRFTSDRFKMGEFVNPWWLTALAWVVAVIIASLNAWLLIQTGMGWLERR